MASQTYPGLQGRTAIVTGGAKGIGAACVQILAEQGAKVAILDLDYELGNSLAHEAGSECIAYELDVSNSSLIREAIRKITEQLGLPTLLVNNAGIGHYGTVVETTDEQLDRVLDVNLKSYFFCAREVVPHMLTAGMGSIVNVASVQSFMSQKRVAAYCASKAGIIGLTRAIAVDHAPSIRCNAVCPGTVDTPMLADAISELPDQEAILQECRDMYLTKRIAEPMEIAQLVTYLLSDLSSFITGQAIRIDGGIGLEIGGSVQD
ncbi:SDR family NAD(P)-dependent oxidoreductase [Bythopirellula goksoeyrii]|uniref:Cyclopentanol dehydrogenase n=1 Tax=Bythopirellula goksoeyrii TaxID=1400387 RepID=A0A5B9QEU5_9BACT|nr:glucose 1-dehydrogenase [Bythopirellula goksoeyrii]QEG36409.1 Cyclopentanol dehydrogenase [Bythopirellula goksoeyrii]